jgi:hypothetical protein
VDLISTPRAQEELRADWEGAGRMRARMARHVSGAFVGLPQPGLAHAVYNLPLLLAFDVLKEALLQARAEKRFDSRSETLGGLMLGR